MTRRRIILGLFVAVAMLIGGAGLYLRHSARTLWSDLRAAADLTLPHGYSVVEREERGTAFCLITCAGEGEAQILLTVAGPAGADPCADLEAALADSTSGLTTEPPLGLLGCLYADLPSVGSDAFLTVRPEVIPGIDGCVGDRRPCALLLLSSGID